MKIGRMSGKLRIMRTWENRDADTGQFYCFYMILQDRFGEKIHCTITPAQYDMHMEKFREQNVISKKFFSIVESKLATTLRFKVNVQHFH
ncbi:hypothetical protein MKX01_035539 [Papaver californicum]|nr:hypothetical protein MKX01_035539 [Papaver californicum]